ncbi:mitochondrial ribosome-associated GTPase 1-like isoform X2 [Mya arenaria]|nr:mitochondrial ribosome-associated GTPase 1-like isoform X2 [Mya arenaria]XP_052812324.1 mitochondrial ribosome-associated GTPase 1-like isoform X2 [Mya arenaria]
MKKGVEQIQASLHNIDGVLEIHDARIPFSGRNNQLRDVFHVRPHVLVLNKSDLADLSRKKEIEEKLYSQGINHVQFTASLAKDIFKVIRKDIVPILLKDIQSRPRFRPDIHNHYNIMVIGVPNVGKSTMLNKLRESYTKQGKGAAVGASPGVTRSVMNKVRVNFDPDMYVVDTPGILSPKIGSVDTGMRLCLCDSIPNRLMGEDHIVDYMLYWLNKHHNFKYVKYYDLKEPCDDVMDFLAQIAIKNQFVMKTKELTHSGGLQYRLNFVRAATFVLKDFQRGNLGKIMLDDDYLDF